MNLSPSMQFVMMRASAEAKAAHAGQPGVECLFLGILKFSEVKAEEIMKAPPDALKIVNADIAEVGGLLAKADI